MTGGLLQLVAKSVEDIFLTNDPEITLFKVVYRRHTNFSKEEKQLRFSNKLDFGKKGICRLRPYADFIGQLYLVLKIPTIDIRYKILKISDVKSILQTNNITWTTSDPDTADVTDVHLDEILVAINNYKALIQLERDTITHETNRDILTVVSDTYVDGTISDEDFFERLLEEIIRSDSNYSVVYEFIKAYKEDETDVDNTFTNLKQLRSVLFDNFKEKIISNDNTTFHDENINLLDIIYRNTFPIKVVDTGITSKTHFVNTLAQIYAGIDDQYTQYDSFKIVEQYLSLKQTIISNIFDVDEIKNDIFNHILYNMGKNIQLLIKIYNNLGLNYKFTFYKRYLYSSTTESNSTNEEFINLSTTNISRFNDNFTNNFVLSSVESESNNLTHFYSDYVSSFITPYHVANRNYFRIGKYEDYFANTALWKKMDLLTLKSVADEKSSKLAKFYILDLIPRVLISDINAAFVFILKNTLEITGSNAPNLIGLGTKLAQLVTPLITTLQTEIKVDEIITDNEIDLLFTLSGIYRKNTDNDIFVVGFFKFYKYFIYKATSYNVMEYIRQIYTNRTISMIQEYENERVKLTLNTDLSWLTLNEASIGTSSTARNMYITLTSSDGNIFNSSGIGNYFLAYSAYDAIKYVVWYKVDNGTTAPSIEDSTLVQIDISASDNASTIMATTASALNALNEFTSTAANSILNIKNASVGICTPPTFSQMPNRLTLAETTTGYGSSTLGAARVLTITTQAKANYKTSESANYFLIYNANNASNYYVWLKTGTNVTNPNVDGYSELLADISGSTTAAEVATVIATVVNSNGHFIASSNDAVVTITNADKGLSGPGTIGSSTDTNYKAVMNIVDMFFMTDDPKADDTETILPEYKKYKSNSLSLFQINNSRVQFLNPLGSTSDEALVIDAPSSMWYNIYTKLIDNYNSFYDKLLLNSYIDDFLGKNVTEFKAYIDQNETANIFKTLADGDGDDYKINYYLASSTQTEKITNSTTGYLSLQLNALNTLITLHNTNKNILKISHATLPIKTKLFETFSNMYTVFEDIIYQSFDSVTLSNSVVNTGYEHTPSLIDFETVKTSLATAGVSGVMDKFNAIQTAKDIFYDIGNDAGSLTPLALDVKTSVSYNANIKNVSTTVRTNLKTKYDDLFSTLTSTILNNDINNIVNNFNSFAKESDLYNYMINITRKASLLKPILTLEASSRLATRDNILSYYNDRIVSIDESLSVINGTGANTSSLYTTISDMKKGILTPKFAWVEHLGHYIINNTYIDIGGEIIDNQTGEWLHINKELTLPFDKEKGYNRLIGHLPNLHTYNNVQKKEITLYIPLQHWFCKRISSVLPIIALNHTFVDLHVNLKELSECSYWENLTYFKKRPQLSAYVLANYFYIEPSERKALVKAKHEMLIETVQYQNNVHINSYSLENNSGEIKLYFQGPCKEYLWIAQKSTYENGTYLSPQTKYTFDADGLVTTVSTIKKKSLHYYGENEDGTGNPLKQIKFNFNGVEREKFKDSMVYDTVYPHKCHTRIPPNGIMVYPLCLYPELLQPSGTANNSQIDDVEFIFTVTDKMYAEMVASKTTLRFAFYAISYNILRIMSGMSGLAYLES